jgi:hypothetical protein
MPLSRVVCTNLKEFAIKKLEYTNLGLEKNKGVALNSTAVLGDSEK